MTYVPPPFDAAEQLRIRAKWMLSPSLQMLMIKAAEELEHLRHNELERLRAALEKEKI